MENLCLKMLAVAAMSAGSLSANELQLTKNDLETWALPKLSGQVLIPKSWQKYEQIDKSSATYAAHSELSSTASPGEKIALSCNFMKSGPLDANRIKRDLELLQISGRPNLKKKYRKHGDWHSVAVEFDGNENTRNYVAHLSNRQTGALCSILMYTDRANWKFWYKTFKKVRDSLVIEGQNVGLYTRTSESYQMD
jgi:hypothetical protein